MFAKHFFRKFSSDAAKLVRAVEKDRMVTLTWSDGHVGEFPVIWLRDTSPDAKTYTMNPAMKARNLVMNEFDVEQEPKSMKLDKKSNELVMEWPGDVESRFASSWLRLRDPSSKTARERRRKVYLLPEKRWGKKEIEQNLKKFDHNDVMNDDKALHDFLEAVCLDGIALIRNGPKGEKGVVEEIGRKIGMIKRTHFGTVFEVTTKPDASNMAYASNNGLPFHTDFTSLAHPPHLQMLHMFSRAAEGGNSLFVDGFHVAEKIRRERPEVFEILTKYSMEFIEEGFDLHTGNDNEMMKFDFDMAARHKTIKLDDSGKIVKISFGNAMRSWFYDCDPRKIQDIYRALKVFTEYCYDEENILKIRLENGDTVLWANTRVLHTRDAFRNAPGQSRTLTGCYFDWDIVKSRVRVLRDTLNLPQNQPSV